MARDADLGAPGTPGALLPRSEPISRHPGCDPRRSKPRDPPTCANGPLGQVRSRDARDRVSGPAQVLESHEPVVVVLDPGDTLGLRERRACDDLVGSGAVGHHRPDRDRQLGVVRDDRAVAGEVRLVARPVVRVAENEEAVAGAHDRVQVHAVLPGARHRAA